MSTTSDSAKVCRVSQISDSQTDSLTEDCFWGLAAHCAAEPANEITTEKKGHRTEGLRKANRVPQSPATRPAKGIAAGHLQGSGARAGTGDRRLALARPGKLTGLAAERPIFKGAAILG